MKQLQIFLFLSLCLFMKGCEESNEPTESREPTEFQPLPSQPPSLGTCSDILYPAPLPPGKPLPPPLTQEDCIDLNGGFGGTDCEGAGRTSPADFSLANETTMSIRLVYGTYDGSCLPPRLSSDMHIPAGSSLEKHLEIGTLFIPLLNPILLTDSIFPSHTVMVVFNEERFSIHAKPEPTGRWIGDIEQYWWDCDELWRFFPYPEREDGNLFCGRDYFTEEGYIYAFTEEDYAQATPFPRDP